MDTEQLLAPRFKVIASYPNSIFKVGEVITIGRHEGVFCDPDGPKYSDFPAIFQRLQWWEDLHVDDFPAYVKVATDCTCLPFGTIHKVLAWMHLGPVISVGEGDNVRFSVSDFLPATLTDYLTYQKQQNG